MKLKRIMSITLAAIMLLALPGLSLAKDKADRTVAGGIFKLTTVEDFNLGTLENVVVDEAVGDGAVKLAKGAAKGEYVSDIIGVEPFEYMVASWNADVPKGASVEILGRAYVDMKGEWSDWCSWGVWEKDIKRGCSDDENDLAYMDTDTLTIKGSNGETASLVQLKAVLEANESGESPVVSQVAATYKNTLDGQAITPLYYGEKIELPQNVILDTPAYSQNIRERTIAGVMCSATTVTVLLNDRGEDLLPEEVALCCYDSEYEGFGNWAFSVAAAGAFGYEATCQYADLDVLRQELAHGYSVGLSVRYSSSSLEGAPISSTNGHLITITGYETVDGVDYFYSSDSAAGNDPGCLVRYRADQLDNCWPSKLAYIVHDKDESAAKYAPKRIAAELVPLEGQENGYTLVVDGQPLEINKNISAMKLRADGGGIIAFYVEEAQKAAMPERVKLTTANSIIRYTVMAGDNFLIIDPQTVLAGIGDKGTVHIFVMMNDGVTYEAALALELAAEPNVSPEPAAEPAAEETAQIEPATDSQPPAEPAAAKAEQATGSGIWIIAAAIAVVIIAAIVVLNKNKTKK